MPLPGGMTFDQFKANLMRRRNPRTGKRYTEQEAAAVTATVERRMKGEKK